MFDSKKYKKIYIVGIKGVGVAALAEFLKDSGCEVSGSDVPEEFMTDSALKKAGISVFGFSENDFSAVDAVVRSVAYNKENNTDIKKAEDLGIPVFTYPEVISWFFNNKFGVAVSGSHGKTTTTAMLAYILDRAGKNVNAIVGSKVNEWGSGAKINDIKKNDAIFVLEADEYKKAFLRYKPKAAVITSIDYDHPDCYKTKEEYEDVFLEFAESISENGFLVANRDYEEIIKITKNLKCKVIFYGKDKLVDLKIKIPGEHNLYNANAAYLSALELDVSKDDAKKYIEEFKGTARRFEILGKNKKTTIVDDYAHHPSEIKATLLGVRNMFFSKKIIAVFQPHTYSRTKKFSDNFSNALDLADEVVLMDVYSSARESIDKNVSIKEISDRIGKKSIYVKNKEDIIKHCKKYLNEDSVVIFMGAGDIWQEAHKLLRY